MGLSSWCYGIGFFGICRGVLGVHFVGIDFLWEGVQIPERSSMVFSKKKNVRDGFFERNK